MRIAHAAVACIAIVSGAGGVRADGIAAGPNDARALTTSPLISRYIGHGVSGVLQAPNSWRPTLGFGIPQGSKAGDNRIRLAQIGPPTAPVEESSGNPSFAPFKWVGLLNEPHPTKDHPNQSTSCTAQFIAPRVLLTAGHCIKDLPPDPTVPPSDPKTWTFWLQYQNFVGVKFNVVCAKENPKWVLPANFASMTNDQQNAAMDEAYQHDFGMILVDHDSPTGVMPYALDWKGKVTYAYRVGYPENILDSEIVQSVPGIVFFTDALPMNVPRYAQPNMSSPNIVGQWGPITDATQGMSGGAWVYDPDPTEAANSNILVAVTSFGPFNRFKQPFYPGGTFAAYLTAAEFNPLFTSVAKGCQ
jgi:hypothetical protein